MLDPGQSFLLATAKPVTSDALSPGESLAISVTMEGLLFAAFSVGIAVMGITKRGRSTFFTKGWFGWCIVAVIAAVAAAAGASWWVIYRAGWPESGSDFLLGLGLAAGIAAQPVIAGVINYQSTKE